jgi:hypothetical protein
VWRPTSPQVSAEQVRSSAVIVRSRADQAVGTIEAKLLGLHARANVRFAWILIV